MHTYIMCECGSIFLNIDRWTQYMEVKKADVYRYVMHICKGNITSFFSDKIAVPEIWGLMIIIIIIIIIIQQVVNSYR